MAFEFPFQSESDKFAFGPFDVGGFEFGVRWYALAYMGGLILGWLYLRWLARRSNAGMTNHDVDDFLAWATFGVVLGGRVGYVLFYKPLYYLSHPVEIFYLWQGGMSFHGGALGVIIAMVLFCRQRSLPFLRVADILCCTVPIGLFLGRIANFINGELFGRAAYGVPWAVIFPQGGPVPRHPSQLYEAGLEGLILFLVLFLCWRVQSIRERAGALAGLFLSGYGVARIIAEFFREPDAHLGFLFAGATMGQILSVPMVVMGLILIWRSRRLVPS